MLKVGVAKADITPRAGIQMSGFGKRIQPALGVNDPIYATAIVLDDGQTTIAVVDCDLLMVNTEFTAEVREQVERLTRISAPGVLISCTHCHYGPPVVGTDPNTLSPRPTYERAYREYLRHQLAGLVFEAQASLSPARLKAGVGESDIGINRREKTPDGRIILGHNPAGPADRSVGVCRIETPDGQPLAAIVNFTCHPVTQDVQIRKISADYVGRTRRVVQETTGAPCLFFQGACGDINIRAAETNYQTASDLGAQLGREAARVWAAAEPIDAERVRSVLRTVELPPYRGLSLEHAEQRVRESQKSLEATRANPKSTPGLIEWGEREVKKAQALRDSWTDASRVPPPVKAELQAFRVGDLAWACVPGELFNELGSEIKRRSPVPHTFVVAYANDWIGYLPTRRAFDEGGYEVSQVCNVAPEAMGMIVDQLVDMLGAL